MVVAKTRSACVTLDSFFVERQLERSGLPVAEAVGHAIPRGRRTTLQTVLVSCPSVSGDHCML